MNNSMIAHLWANKSKEEAHGSNFYFIGKSIYSYGCHFEAGRIVENKRGRAYLINEERVSATTSKHQSYVRRAIPSEAMVFSIGYNMSDRGSMLFVTDRLEAIKGEAEKYKKARVKRDYLNMWRNFKNLMDYIEFFDMPDPKQLLKKNANYWITEKCSVACESDKSKKEYVRELKRVLKIMMDCRYEEDMVDGICGEGTYNEYTERCRRYRMSMKAKRDGMIESMKKTLEERVSMWKSGEIRDVFMQYEPEQGEPNAWLRVREGIIETSKGIRLDMNEAGRLWRYVRDLHKGSGFRHELVKDKTGNRWKIDRYENDLLVAGCHRIGYGEMEGIAKQLGIYE